MFKEYTIHLDTFGQFIKYCRLERKFTFNGSVWSPEFSAGAHELLHILLNMPAALTFMPGLIADGREEEFDRYMKESGLLKESVNRERNMLRQAQA